MDYESLYSVRNAAAHIILCLFFEFIMERSKNIVHNIKHKERIFYAAMEIFVFETH